MSYSYAHMCRDDHIQIGHNDSEHEQCPLCRANAEIERLLAALEGIADELLPAEQTGWLSSSGKRILATIRETLVDRAPHEQITIEEKT